MKLSIIVSLALIPILFFSGCQRKTQQETLVFCVGVTPPTLSPQIASSAYNTYVPMFEGLVKTSLKGDLIPAIARSWKISSDGLKFQLELNKGIQFHSNDVFKPTRDLRAEDVKFTFDRMLKKEHPFHKVSAGKYVIFFASRLEKLIKSVEAGGPYTVRFELHSPNPEFLQLLSSIFGGINSKEYADGLIKTEKKEWLDEKPVGTGPFKFKSFKQDESIVYVRHDGYHGKKSKIQRLVYRIVPDPMTRLQMLRRKECHASHKLPRSSIAEVRKDKTLKVTQLPLTDILFLVINTKKKPLDRLPVRKAIYHAMNRRAYVDALYYETAKLAKTPLPEGHPFYHSKLKNLDYDPDKSKELLEEAGFKKGFKTTLWYQSKQTAYNPSGKQLAVMMQQDLKKVGIEAELVTHEWSNYYAKAFKGEHDLFQTGLNGNEPTIVPFFEWVLVCENFARGYNFSWWCNPDYDRALLRAKTALSAEAQKQHYQKAQEIFHREIPWVPLVYSNDFIAQTSSLEGVKVSNHSMIDFSEAYFKK